MRTEKLNEFGNSLVHINLAKILQRDEYKRHHRAVARALEAMNRRCASIAAIADTKTAKYILIMLVKTANCDFGKLPRTVQTHARNAMVANIRNYMRTL